MAKLIVGLNSCFATTPNMGRHGMDLSDLGSGPVEDCCEHGYLRVL